MCSRCSAKTYHVLIANKGIGKQVKNTVIRRKSLRPHISDKAPIKGALRNDKNPYEQNNTSRIIIFKLAVNDN